MPTAPKGRRFRAPPLRGGIISSRCPTDPGLPAWAILGRPYGATLGLSLLPAHDRQRQPRLVLVLALLVGVARLARGRRPEEQQLRDPLIRVQLCRQRRGVG